jgi:hypothetical protein
MFYISVNIHPYPSVSSTSSEQNEMIYCIQNYHLNINLQ